MAKVQKYLTGAEEDAKKKSRNGKLVQAWLPVPEYEELKKTVAERQMNISDYVRARLRGTATRDRTDMATVVSLHVAGRALMALATSQGRSDQQQLEVAEIIAELRSLTTTLAGRIR